MRIRVFDAVLLFLVALLVILVSLTVLAISFGLISTDVVTNFANLLSGYWLNSIIAGFICVVVILLVLWLLISVFAGRSVPAAETSIITQSENGTVSITLGTLVELCTNAAKKNPSVKEIKCRVFCAEESSIGVKLAIAFQPDSLIAQEAQNIQDLVRDEIHTITALAVNDVTVVVDNSLNKAVKNSKSAKG